MTASIFILPTMGRTTYRGKYPTRARSISAGTTGRHIELNNGTRLWAFNARDPEFCAGGLSDDYATSLARAVPMTAGQYETLKEAAELARTVIQYAGRGRRDEIFAQVRAMLESIKADDSQEAARDAQAESPAPANPTPHGESIIRLNLRRQAGELSAIANREAGELGGPGLVRVIDATPTWAAILPLLRAAIENGTSEGRAIAWAELARMAGLADERNRMAASRPSLDRGSFAAGFMAGLDYFPDDRREAIEQWIAESYAAALGAS